MGQEDSRSLSEADRLGQGGFGAVYRGVLVRKDRNHHQVVAVKRLSRSSRQGEREYVSEVDVISQLRHRNLVSLIGWCHERGERLLVYEYMAGGSLDSHLFGNKMPQVLFWEQRMEIALDVAAGLLYLHEEWLQCVVHRDVKASNVMIDSDFNARLGDFGLARLVDHAGGYARQTTAVVGSNHRIYIAPECLITGKVSKASDVYSFGVLLLEIACGRSASQPAESATNHQRERTTTLLGWVWEHHTSGVLAEAIDERLGGGEFINGEEAMRMMMVGLWCALPDPRSRPSIREAINTLNSSGKLPELPPDLQTPFDFCSYPNSEARTASSSASVITGGGPTSIRNEEDNRLT